jgi:hypothetical protein
MDTDIRDQIADEAAHAVASKLREYGVEISGDEMEQINDLVSEMLINRGD